LQNIADSDDFASVLSNIRSDDEIKAVCESAGKQQRVGLLDLPLPSPPPSGAEWIAAYRRWRGG
jgi:hypothetical protein